jgi:hypothetical protein
VGRLFKPPKDGLQTRPTLPAARCWLGAPNSIKGPTEAVFQRQSGNHLLIVGQREDAALTMLGLSLLALAAQYPAGSAKFFFFHQANPGSPEADFLDRIIAAVPHAIRVVRAHEVAQAMNEIATEMKHAAEGKPSARRPRCSSSSTDCTNSKSSDTRTTSVFPRVATTTPIPARNSTT